LLPGGQSSAVAVEITVGNNTRKPKTLGKFGDEK